MQILYDTAEHMCQKINLLKLFLISICSSISRHYHSIKNIENFTNMYHIASNYPLIVVVNILRWGKTERNTQFQ